MMRRSLTLVYQTWESSGRRRGVLTRTPVTALPACWNTSHIDTARAYKKESNKTATVNITKLFDERKTRALRIRHALEARQMRIKKKMEEELSMRRAKLTMTGRQLRARGKLIMQEIKDTKDMVKERMEEVIEKENVYTIPNFLCVTRILCSPLLGYFIVNEYFGYALGFMAVAGFSDWMDGYIARNYPNQSSKIGSFLDPMADKVLIGTLFLCLTYVDLIPVPLTALIIGRDVILVTAGFVIRYRSLPSPKTLTRYFDASLPTAQLAPTFISKVNTGVQLLLVGSTLAAPVFGFVDHPILHGLWYVTAASTVVAAASYIHSKETYRYLKPGKRPKWKRERLFLSTAPTVLTDSEDSCSVT